MTIHRNRSIAHALRASLLVVLACIGGVFASFGAGDAQAGERCFGAAGQACGGWTNGSAMPSVAFCVHTNGIGIDQGICLVNGGSMTHDPCCVASPNGVMCGGNGTQGRNHCRAEWDRAVNRVVWGYNWKRVVNVNRENDTGVVERPLYCARAGKGVHKNDKGYCCSGDSRPGNVWERIGRPNLNICR